MDKEDKPLFILAGELQTPPMSEQARIEAGYLLRRLQQGEKLSMPQSRPMSIVGRRCHELRIADPEMDKIWRIIYRTDDDAVLVAEVFAKKTNQTPRQVIEVSKTRFRSYDNATR
jgi:phage-related protein